MTDEEKVNEYVKCENCIYYDTNDTRCCFCPNHKHFELKDNLKVDLLEKENAELEEKLKNEIAFNEQSETVKKYKAQIEKMKCCGNCKNCVFKYDEEDLIFECDANGTESYTHLKTCSNWKLAE